MCLMNRAEVQSVTHFIVGHVGILDLTGTRLFNRFILGICTLISIGVG